MGKALRETVNAIQMHRIHKNIMCLKNWHFACSFCSLECCHLPGKKVEDTLELGKY